MTQTTEDKALALFNEVLKEHGMKPYTHMNLDVISNKALCRAIEQHEAFRQEVSDAVDAYLRINSFDNKQRLVCFVIPKPKPDPLVEVIAGWTGGTVLLASDLRAALDAAGFEIREKGNEN